MIILGFLSMLLFGDYIGPAMSLGFEEDSAAVDMALSIRETLPVIGLAVVVVFLAWKVGRYV